jgi:hypothetical protein
MLRNHLLTASVLLLGLLGAFGASVAGAAPLHSPNASVIELSCAANDYGINTVTAVVMDNNGTWSPGHVIAVNGEPTKMMGIPLEFQITVTDANGMNLESADVVKPGNRNGITNTVQCTQTEYDAHGQGDTVTNTITVFLPSFR